MGESRVSPALAYRFEDNEIALSGKWAEELTRGKDRLLHRGPVEVGGQNYSALIGCVWVGLGVF